MLLFLNFLLALLSSYSSLEAVQDASSNNTGREHIVANEQQHLTSPEIETGLPRPGHRVRVSIEDYPDANYDIYLPYNFTNTGKWPVIFEIPCADDAHDATVIGFGISEGKDYIWVSVPYIDHDGKIESGAWTLEPSYTEKFWLAVLKDLKNKYPIDDRKIIIAGFSLGGAGVSGFGNWSSEISSKWAAYFSQSHFDGCCLNFPGNSDERINRIDKRKVLVCAGERDTAKTCSKNAYTKLVSKGVPATYIEIVNWDHFPDWTLTNSQSAQQARNWLNTLFTEN